MSEELIIQEIIREFEILIAEIQQIREEESHADHDV
jgi:hypothetical protein